MSLAKWRQCVYLWCMDTKTTLLASDWATLRKLAREGRISIGKALIDKIKAGHRRWTDEVVIEVHRVTDGAIPCWSLRPDLWAPGQIPPCLSPPAHLNTGDAA